MVTVLEKELRRPVTVDGQAYTVIVDPERLRLVGKGKRKPEVELCWRELLNGDAALAVALNASLMEKQRPAGGPAPRVAGKAAAPAGKPGRGRSDPPR